MDWLPLDSTRVYLQHSAGFVVIKPLAPWEPVPLFCDVCGLPNLTQDDILMHRQHGCCMACALRWTDIHRERWAAGWRPEPEEVARDLRRRLVRPVRLPFQT